MRRLLLVFAALLPASLAAQAFMVDPPQFAAREGVGSFRYAAGNLHTAQTMRTWQFQQIHDNLAANGPVQIKGMAFRRDAGASFNWDPWQAEMELVLSTSPVTSQTYSSVFAGNMGPDATTVISRKWVNFPAIPRTTGMPEPFLFRLVFDPGMTFTLAKGGVLAWHWKGWDNDLHLKTVDHHYLDYEYPSAYSPTKAMPGGCFSGGWGYFRPQYCTTEFYYESTLGKWVIYGYTDHGPYRGTALHAIGLPLKPAGAFIPIGGPDFFGGACRLFIDPMTLMLSAPYALDAKGYGNVPKATPLFTVPDFPELYDIILWSQSLTLDAKNIVYLSNVDMMQPHYRYAPGKAMGVSVLEVAEFNRVNQAWSTFGGVNRAMPTQFQL